jgi:ankyrin repeat protein
MDAQDKMGNSAVRIASFIGYFEIVKYLVQECNANVESKNKHGETIIHVASCNCDFLDIVQYLTQHCHANVELKNKEGWTALHYASTCGILEIVQHLTCHSNVNTTENNGLTALH